MFIGIDLGTSGCRSAVFDSSWRLRALSARTYPLRTYPHGWVEQDAELWWTCVRQTLREAIGAVGDAASSIRAISVSSQGISVAPVDPHGCAMGNAISWLDTRATAETEALERMFGARDIYRITGKRISPLYTMPKIMWLKRHAAERYKNCWKLMLPMEFILYRLCGECVTDHTMAAGTMLYDLERRAWSPALLNAAQIEAQKLPEIGLAGETAGRILPETARELGLREDTVIAIGGQDQKCAALGAGLAPGVATASLGTACSISVSMRSLTLDPEMRIPCFSYLLDRQWVQEGLLNTAAACYSWLRDNFAAGKTFEELNRLAAEAPAPCPTLFFPNLAGGSSPYWGTPSGVFSGMSLHTTLGHLARGVLEGVAYGIRENLEAMRCAAPDIRELRVFGGGSKSDLWCQIIADITDLPVVRLVSAETALMGAAMLACKAVEGEMPDPLPPEKTFAPNAPLAAAYDAAFAQYEKTREAYFA